MKKYKSKLATLSLLGLLSTGIMGCGNQNTDDILDFSVTPFNYETGFEDETLEASTDETEEETVESIKSPEEIQDEVDIVSIETIIANKRTAIIENLENKKIKGYLPAGKSLDLIEKLDNGYCKAEYFGEEVYIKESDVEIAYVFDIKSPIKNVLYATEDTSLIIPDYLSETHEQQTVAINKYEIFEVYDETDILYLVQTPEYIGYIAKDKVEELTGTFVVLDISDQKASVYQNNEVVKEYPVITGTPTPERETPIGKWEIYSIRYNYGLQDAEKTYYSPVDAMVKFCDNVGFHDSTHHTCNYWKSHGRARHGWRTEEQIYTSDTYLTNGSHGCANMINEDVFELIEYVDIGTPVIVKR